MKTSWVSENCTGSAISCFSIAAACVCSSKNPPIPSILSASPIYFAVADIALDVKELEQRGVVFTIKPHLIAEMDDHDLWMAFLADPDDHILALMQEPPKGYRLP